MQGFKMDCGHSFIAAYGQEAWNDAQSLAAVAERIDDARLIGSAIFSQWRYFNHRAVKHAQEKDRQWFLIMFRRLRELSYGHYAKRLFYSTIRIPQVLFQRDFAGVGEADAFGG